MVKAFIVLFAVFAWFDAPAQTQPPLAEPPEVTWEQPVEADVVDFFRPPSHRYGPGNRGLEYATTVGQSVRAVDDGDVVFAGQVGGDLFVVVSHTASLRSTYAYLDAISVSKGDRVGSGDVVGSAGYSFHLTARINGQYVDPMQFLGGEFGVRLIPIPASQVRPTPNSGPSGVLTSTPRAPARVI